MSKKIVLFILFFLSFLLIFLGVIFYLENINNGKNYSSSDSDSLELSSDEIKDIYEKEYNHSSSISKEHCLDTLCMTDAKISYEYNAYGVVTATLTNRSKDSIGPGFINVNFLVDEDVEVLSFYYPLLASNESVPLELQFSSANVLNAKDYTITWPTEEEMSYYESLIY